MAEFTQDRYGVDVMKVEVPVTIKFVEGAHAYAGKKAYTKQDAMEHFRAAAEVATKPFIYLSAGVSNAEFTESLRLAAEAGVKFAGVLLRPGDLEGWHSGLCQGRRGGVPTVARIGRRQEHQQRERVPEGRELLVRGVRRRLGRGAGLNEDWGPRPEEALLGPRPSCLKSPVLETVDCCLTWCMTIARRFSSSWPSTASARSRPLHRRRSWIRLRDLYCFELPSAQGPVAGQRDFEGRLRGARGGVAEAVHAGLDPHPSVDQGERIEL